MTALADAIRNIPLFSGLSREDIAKVLGKFEEISFSAAQYHLNSGRFDESDGRSPEDRRACS